MELDGFTDASAILRSGVYALVSKGKVVYIGKSKAMLGRINTHRRKWIDRKKKDKWSDLIPIPGLFFDEIHVRPCHPDYLDRLEAELINLYKPHYNINLKSHGKKITAPFSITVAGRVLTFNAPRPTIGITRR